MTVAGMTRPESPERITGPWSDLGAAPHSPVRAQAAQALFRHAVRDLPIRVALAGGERLGAGDSRTPLMRIVRPRAFFHRLGADAKIGFGEAYMVGDWDSTDPAGVLTPFAERMSTLVPGPLQSLRRWVDARKPDSERNTTTGARHNIARHYDLSNEVFATFLDETMTYSAGLFAPGERDLATAQRDKIDSVLDLAGVGADTELLEIGCGWGSLAIRAARRGAHVTALTLSERQAQLAHEQVVAAGLGDRVAFRLRDYREIEGRYDAVVSVEMIEAVGAEYWKGYFHALDRLLDPAGRAVIQAITMPHDRMRATIDSYTWIHKYIFPGGQLPSTESIERTVAATGRLRPVQRRAFGASYAETLRQWRHHFNANSDRIAELGFDERFRRMWEFYLAYSEAGFRAGYLDVWQLAFTKTGRHNSGRQ